MQVPLQITFRDLAPSEGIAARIRRKARKLERFHRRITACHVTVEAPNKRAGRGRQYHVTVGLTLPGGEIVAIKDRRRRQPQLDLMAAVGAAFDAAQRQIAQFADRRR